MPLSLQLTKDYEVFRLYGLSTALKPPGLAWYINQKLETSLVFSERFWEEQSTVIYEDFSEYQSIHLLVNHIKHPWHKQLKNLDYFCLFQNFSDNYLSCLQKLFLEIQELQFCTTIPIISLKKNNYLDYFIL